MIALMSMALAPSADAAVYSCEQTTPIDYNLMQHLDFKADAAGLPTRAQVNNVSTGYLLVGPKAVTYTPGYDNGYWLTYYGLESYRIGWSNGDKYVLLVPQAPLGTQFDAQVHVLFGGGAYGSMQNEFHCVRQ